MLLGCTCSATLSDEKLKKTLPSHLVSLSEEFITAAHHKFVATKDDDKFAIGTCTFTKSDLATLDGHSWLNDAIIHSYLSLLSQEYVATNNTAYCFPSFLTQRFLSGNYEGWLYKQVRLQEFRWLFLPVNHNNLHWSLLIGDVKAQTVGIADSMQSSSSSNSVTVDQWEHYMMARNKVRIVIYSLHFYSILTIFCFNNAT